jgi:hypothetical protein
MLGIGNAVIAGFLVGVMIGFPILLATLISCVIVSPVPVEIGFRLAAVCPVLGGLVGVMLGTVLGFVCDVIVAVDFKRRPHRPIAG